MIEQLLHSTRILLLKVLHDTIVYPTCLMRIYIMVLLRVLIISPNVLSICCSGLKIVPVVRLKREKLRGGGVLL